MNKKVEILEYLQEFHTSENNAVSAGELSILFNLSKRGLRAVVTTLRKEHYPVCSSNCGYWYSKDSEDIRKTIARLEAQVSKMDLAIAGLEKCGFMNVEEKEQD